MPVTYIKQKFKYWECVAILKILISIPKIIYIYIINVSFFKKFKSYLIHLHFTFRGLIHPLTLHLAGADVRLNLTSFKKIFTSFHFRWCEYVIVSYIRSIKLKFSTKILKFIYLSLIISNTYSIPSYMIYTTNFL